MENEEFTDEELIELGELDESELDQGGQEETDDQSEDDQGEDDQSNDDGQADGETKTDDQPDKDDQDDKTPDLSDYDKLHIRAESAEQKLELLRKDPNEYYNQYPDEKPHLEQPVIEQPSESKIPQQHQALKVEGGKYEGLTLAQVYEQDQKAAINLLHQVDPATATSMMWDLRDAERREKDAVAAEQQARIAESNKEIEAFSNEIAQEIFGKTELSEEEQKTVDGKIEDVIVFMKKTGRGGGILKDAHYLMNRDNELANARRQGASGLVDKLSKETVKSVSGSKGGSAKSGYDSYMGMSDNEFLSALNNMGDTAYSKFIAEAPADLKAKHPSFDWD